MLHKLFSLQSLQAKLQSPDSTKQILLPQSLFLLFFLMLPPLLSGDSSSQDFATDVILSIALGVTLIAAGYIGFRIINQPFSTPIFILISFAVLWRLCLLTLFFGLTTIYILFPAATQTQAMIHTIDIAWTGMMMGTLLFILPLAINYVAPRTDK